MSVGDMLLSLAYSTTTVATTSTSTLINLNENINNSASGLGNTNTNTRCVGTTCTSATLNNTTLSNSIISMQPTGGQSTFTSEDLSMSQGVPSTAPAPTSTFQDILLNIKNILLKILDYLRPFGGVNPKAIQTSDMNVE
jgi:hypothetical protein